MKRVFLFLFACCVCTAIYSQENRDVKLNKETNLLDVVYYHDNGVVSQTGTYTLDGKLHGKWLQFDEQGEKMISATYDHGIKVGKWFYWQNEILKEVDYSNNAIVGIVEWNEKNSVVLRN